MDLGVRPYREVWDLQQRLQADLIAGTGQEHLLMVEHTPVYTLGCHGKSENLLAEAIIKSRGVECIRIERGGDITFHGPGQLVVYPIISLPSHGLGVKQYIHMLEQVVIDVVRLYGLVCERDADAPGVWLGLDDKNNTRKICAMGVKISHGCTMHGFALNVNTDLSWFSLINPCGFSDRSATSLAAELGRNVDMNHVKQQISGCFTFHLSS